MTSSNAVRSAEELAGEQKRVQRALHSLSGSAWTRILSQDARRGLHELGHFPDYEPELDWTPRQVAGHLRDSARIFAARIQAVQTRQRPFLPDFVTTDPARLADYAAIPIPLLLDELDDAQARLCECLLRVTDDDLARVGVHELDGAVTLAVIAGFLPTHQRDHATQLEALATTPGARAQDEHRLPRGRTQTS